jgi:hypothetical protein
MPYARIEPVVSECRVYASDRPAWDAAHEMSCNLLHDPHDPQAATITMLTATGPQPRSMLRALARALVAEGIVTVYAHRRAGHTLPGATLLPDGRLMVDLRRWATTPDTTT